MNHPTLCLAVLLVVTGCSTSHVQQLYQGPTRDLAKIARIRIPTDIEVAQVDKQHVKLSYVLPGSPTQELHVLPGTHVVKARFAVIRDVTDWEHISFESTYTRFSFDARAGQTYEIRYDEPDEDIIMREFSVPIDIWLVDAEGAPVSKEVTREVYYAHATEEQDDHAPAQPSLNQLKAWWIKSDEAERETFLEWIRDER